MTPLFLPDRLADEVMAHAYAEHPDECVGLVVGKAGRATEVVRLPNMIEGPQARVRFEVDPAVTLSVFESLDDDGLDVLALYHSHTGSEGIPSAMDIGIEGIDAHLIASTWDARAGKALRAWRVERGEAHEVAVVVERGRSRR